VKGMRVAGVKTIGEANRYLEQDYLVWWERELTVEPSSADDAHRPLEKTHNLAASLSYVETRQIRNDYTFRWEGDLYQIERGSVVSGMRGAAVRVEKRLDGSMAVRYGERYLKTELCPVPAKTVGKDQARRPTAASKPRPKSDWNRNFDLKKAPKIWQAIG
jgi:hypothetical protein